MSTPQAPIEVAILDWQSQQHIPKKQRVTLRTIAHKNGVPHNTLSRRLSRQNVSAHEAQAYRQSLTPTEELSLVDYIRRQSISGNPPSPAIVREAAHHLRQNRLRLELDDELLPNPIGVNWIQKFRKRHPEVLSVWSRPQNRLRIGGTSPQALAPFFAEMTTILRKNHYQTRNIFNMDETGYAIGAIQSSQVLTVVDMRAERKKGMGTARKAPKGSSRQEWVTTIECVNAAGTALPPLVIYKGVQLLSQWVPDTPETAGWRWTTSHSGWTNSTLSYEWLTTVFEPATTPSDLRERCLLIIDGASSHLKGQFIAFCVKHSINLMVLPAHSSHKTQPLDVGVFAPLKRALTGFAERATIYHSGRITRPEWAQWLATARAKALTEKNIKGGWKASGLHPFNPSELLGGTTPPSTPPLSQTMRTPLGSIQTENRDFIHHNMEIMKTPIKQRFSEMTNVMEDVYARAMLMEKENNELRAALESQKRAPRAGVTVTNAGSHLFTSEKVREFVNNREAEMAAKKAATAAKKAKVAEKTKGKGKAVAKPVSDDEEMSENDLMVELGLEEL